MPTGEETDLPIVQLPRLHMAIMSRETHQVKQLQNVQRFVTDAVDSRGIMFMETAALAQNRQRYDAF